MSSIMPGTYRLYKNGTAKILNWLYENAVKCGYGADEDGSDGEEEEPGAKKKRKPKTKGKGKKGHGSKAKGSGKAKVKKAKDPLEEPKVFRVQAFIELAEVIADTNEPKIKVPLWVIEVTKEVIKGRQKQARMFSRQSQDTTSSHLKENNMSHQHFITVLERVLQILGPYSSSETPNTASVSNDVNEDPLSSLANIFDALEIEPDTEHTLTKPAEPTQTKQRVVYEEEPSGEEVSWLIYCFFEDFNIVREHLKDMWTTYKSGNLDLTQVALATNTAFEIFQRAEEDLMTELQSITPEDLKSQWKDPHMIQKYLYTLAAIQRGQDPNAKRRPGDPYNFHLFDIADWTCLCIWGMIKSFLAVVKPEGVPICTPGFFGQIRWSEEPLFPHEKFEQDKIVLLERLLPEYVFLARTHDPRTNKLAKIPGEDKLTEGIRTLIRTKEISLWLVLALQVQLDVHYMLLQDTSRGFTELSATSKRTIATLESYLSFSKEMHLDSWPAQNDTTMKLVIFECKMFIERDFLDDVRKIFYDALGRTRSGEFVLLKRNPVLCGMVMFRFNILMQELGIVVANAWGALPCVLHLYNAALSEGTVSKPWGDLEGVVLANTPGRIFVGDRPIDRNAYLKRFKLVMGHSATEFASERRSTGVQVSRRGPREMIASSPIIRVYCSRYMSGKPDANLGSTLDAIEEILLQAAGTVELPSGDQQTSFYGNQEKSEATLMGGRFNFTDDEKNKPKSAKARRVKPQRLTGVQLLSMLQSAMHKESFPVNVNYFALHIKCYEILRELHSILDPTLSRIFGHEYITRESQLPFLVGWIFQVVDGSGDISVQNKLLSEVGKVLSAWIEREGEVEQKKVRKLCARYGGMELVVSADGDTLFFG